MTIDVVGELQFVARLRDSSDPGRLAAAVSQLLAADLLPRTWFRTGMRRSEAIAPVRTDRATLETQFGDQWPEPHLSIWSGAPESQAWAADLTIDRWVRWFELRSPREGPKSNWSADQIMTVCSLIIDALSPIWVSAVNSWSTDVAPVVPTDRPVPGIVSWAADTPIAIARGSTRVRRGEHEFVLLERPNTVEATETLQILAGAAN